MLGRNHAGCFPNDCSAQHNGLPVRMDRNDPEKMSVQRHIREQAVIDCNEESADAVVKRLPSRLKG